MTRYLFRDAEGRGGKKMFNRAIVSEVSRSFAHGLSGQAEQGLGKPNMELVQKQHTTYIRALEKCGLTVEVLPADDEHPDSTFVEDVAVVVDECALITNPAPVSRNGEIRRMTPVLKKYRDIVHGIEAPGTLEGGDVLQIDRDFFVGLTARTNEAGARQLRDILAVHGYRGTLVPLHKLFHLKCGVSYLGEGWITIAGELVHHSAFASYKKIVVADEDIYSCNSLRVNNYVLTPAGFPRTRNKLVEAGFDIIELDMSEFRKQDGGLTCLSLRFRG